MNSADLLKLLKSHGFIVVGARGSHHKLRNAMNITVIVPHPKKDLGKGLVAAILTSKPGPVPERGAYVVPLSRRY